MKERLAPTGKVTRWNNIGRGLSTPTELKRLHTRVYAMSEDVENLLTSMEMCRKVLDDKTEGM